MIDDASQADALVERAAAGDPAALGELLQRYRERLHRMVRFRWVNGAVGERHNADGQSAGTVHFMAPEQADDPRRRRAGRRLQPRLHAVLPAGRRRSFPGAAIADVLKAHRERRHRRGRSERQCHPFHSGRWGEGRVHTHEARCGRWSPGRTACCSRRTSRVRSAVGTEADACSPRGRITAPSSPWL
jgi:hypothetical protein